MIFKEQQQRTHREVFIEECRQKAWGCACHAEWIAKNLDELMATYEKLRAEDAAIAVSIKEQENALDHHTVDNRNKRKSMQERRNDLAQKMQALGENMKNGHEAMQQLIQSADTNLSLAEHAEKWSWKEAELKNDDKSTYPYTRSKRCDDKNCKWCFPPTLCCEVRIY
jgi:hypothetical protein